MNKMTLLDERKVDLGIEVSSEVKKILNGALSGNEVSLEEGITLFNAKDGDKLAVYKVADEFRKRSSGEHVSFVINRNINFTNICYMGCKFCNFAKRTEDKDAEWLELEQVVQRAQVAWDRGATEVCIQGGLHPKMSGNYYREILLAIKSKIPNMHIHAFSPFEIWYGSKKTKLSYRDFLLDLKECGLGSMPGTAAEILDTEVRQKLTKNKLSAEKWIEIIRTAHQVGIKTSATIMYGHVDGPRHWAAHIAVLRDIQKETGGFTELVPLSFVHTDSPLYTNDPENVRPGPTLDEVDLMHAVSRIMLHGWIDNIQVSWTKLGAERAQSILNRGVNDFGGTLMNESISRAAGSKNGQEITALEIVKMIRAAGRIPVRRNTLYEIKEIYQKHDPIAIEPLVERKGYDPLSFLETFPKNSSNTGKLQDE